MPDTQWRRLSPRMLLVHPVREAARALPALVGLLIAGSTTGQGQLWALLGVGALIGFSVLRWYTTRFHITAEQVQLRTGLLRRKSVSTPADRVRSVDVTASPLHRVLGLAKVQIGTGDKDSGLELDSLTTKEAHRLRAELLHRATPLNTAANLPTDTAHEQGYDANLATAGVEVWRPAPADAIRHEPAKEQGEAELARLDPRWIRFAPFTASGLLTALAVLGIGWRLVDQLEIDPTRVGVFQGLWAHLSTTPVWVDVLQAAVVLAVGVVLLAVGGYVLSYWGFRLTRHTRGTLHLTRGLLTTRATSIEERRLRGVELNDSLLLRVVRGARVEAITTGLHSKPGSDGSSLLLPPAPMAEARRVAAEVVGAWAPVDCPLTAHGAAARRRRYVRAILPWVALLAAAGVAWRVRAEVPAWVLLVPGAPLLVAPLLAADRYRNLGHAVSGPFLVTRSGSIGRSRSMLAREGIIGWNLQQTLFQRRAGLVTLTATTAAGDQAYPVPDLPVGRGLSLAVEATPGLLDEFLVRGG